MARARKPQANRTDLLSPEPKPRFSVANPGNGRAAQPDVVPSGLPYGQAAPIAAQEQSGGPMPNTQGSQLADAFEAARKGIPGRNQRAITPLNAPTQRPGEHIMTGAMGPNGIGQPVSAPPPAPSNAVADSLDAMAAATGSPTLLYMAQATRNGAR